MTTLLNALQSLPFQEKHRDLQMRRVEGLGQWLLNTPKFGEWREGFLRQNILWCHGGPGVGKSFLAYVRSPCYLMEAKDFQLCCGRPLG
jgi:hypothetical protein